MKKKQDKDKDRRRRETWKRQRKMRQQDSAADKDDTLVRGEIMSLTMGVDSPSPSESEEQQRIANLCATVEHYLPEYAKMTQQHTMEGADVVMLHQDAFAGGYDMDEYTLLGMVLKYAGLRGVPVQIIGRNKETF